MGKTPEELLELVVKTADDRQAKDIIAIDMKGISILADYNVISHASNKRLINAIAEVLWKKQLKRALKPKVLKGNKMETGSWLI